MTDSAIVSDAQLMSIVKQIAAGADEESDSWKALNATSHEELVARLQRIQRAMPAENRERVSLAFVLCLLSYEYENNKDIILLDFSKEPHQKNSNADWEAELIHRLIVRGDTRLLPVLFEAAMWADGALAASLSGYLTYHLQKRPEQFLVELRPKSYAIRRGVYGRISSDELLQQKDLYSIMRYLESVPRNSALFGVAQEMLVSLRKGLRH